MNKNVVTITLEYPDAHELSRLLDTLNRFKFHNEHVQDIIQCLQHPEVVKAIGKVQDDLNKQLDYILSEFRYCLQDLGDLEQIEPSITKHIEILERIIIEREPVSKVAYWIWELRQLISKYNFGISQRLDDFVGFYKKEEVKHDCN